MAFVPTENAVTASLRYLWNNQQVENTLSFYKASGWSEGDATLLAESLITWRNTNLRALQATTLTLNEVYVVDQSAADGFAVTVVTDEAERAGTATGPSMPNNVTLAIQFRTAARGRSGRGRNFVLALTEGQVADNLVNSGVGLAYISGYAALAGVAEDLSAYHCVISKEINNAPRTEGLVRAVTAYAFANLIVDSQRRRLPGRGA